MHNLRRLAGSDPDYAALHPGYTCSVTQDGVMHVPRALQ